MLASLLQLGTRRSRVVALALASALLLVGAQHSLAAELRKVTFALGNNTVAVDTAMYTSIPLTLNYFRDEGLDVKLVPLNGSAPAAQLVIGGGADVTVAATSAGLLVPASRGADLVSFYEVMTHNFQFPAVPFDSPIKSVADFKGKKIGVISLGSGVIATLKVMLKEVGLDPERDVTFVPIGTGAQALAAMYVNKSVDVFGLWDGPHAYIQAIDPVKYRLRILSTPKAAQLSFLVAAVTKRQTVEKQSGMLIGFGRAVAKGTTFALANPEAAVAIHYKLFPEQRPSGVSEADALRQGVVALRARLANVRIDDKENWPRKVWGWNDPAEVEAYYNVLRQSGEIAAPIKDLSAVYTNRFIDQINDFDGASIRARAASWPR